MMELRFLTADVGGLTRINADKMRIRFNFTV